MQLRLSPQRLLIYTAWTTWWTEGDDYLNALLKDIVLMWTGRLYNSLVCSANLGYGKIPPSSDHWDFGSENFHLLACYWKWQPTPVFLSGESQERRSLVGCRLWSRTESDTTEAT